MENQDYDYKTKPHSQAKIFDIHSLSQDGFSQYISPESHTHNYLDKMNTNYFKSFIFNAENKLRKSFSSSFLQSPPPEECKEQIKNNENLNKENADNFQQINQNQINGNSKQNVNQNLDQNFDQNPNEINNFQEENFLSPKNQKNFGYKTTNGFFPNNNNSNKKSNNKNNFLIFSNKKNNTNNKQNNQNQLMSNTNNNFYVKSNNDLLSRRLNFTSSSFNRTQNPKNINRFDKSYASNLNVLSSKDYFNNKNKTENKTHRRYQGFQSFNVPRVEKENIDFKKPMNKLAQSIGKSCTGEKRLSYENAFSSEKLKEVKQENVKLFEILKNQTNKNFLKFSNLPNISQVMDLPKLKIKKSQEMDRVKHMGDRYNPYNFQAGRDCESMRRNHVGGLFNRPI